MWSDDQSGGSIPAKTKRVVRLRQDGKCICLYARVCTGEIEEYDHVLNVSALRIERSHANDPALIQGVCRPCRKQKTQAEQLAAHRCNLLPPQENPAPRVDDNPGQSLVTIKE